MKQQIPNNNHIPQPSFNQNYMLKLMINPEDISDPTTVMNMALVLIAKAFKLNYSTPTNNNQKITSNPRNMQIAQPEGKSKGKGNVCLAARLKVMEKGTTEQLIIVTIKPVPISQAENPSLSLELDSAACNLRLKSADKVSDIDPDALPMLLSVVSNLVFFAGRGLPAGRGLTSGPNILV
ncbi:hypothetical protein Tco_0268788 [Tanacetum coccineum]